MADRIDEHGAGAGPPDLNQIGAVGVTETGGPFGVHRERAVAAGQQLSGGIDFAGSRGEVGHPVGGME